MHGLKVVYRELSFNPKLCEKCRHAPLSKHLNHWSMHSQFIPFHKILTLSWAYLSTGNELNGKSINIFPMRKWISSPAKQMYSIWRKTRRPFLQGFLFLKAGSFSVMVQCFLLPHFEFRMSTILTLHPRCPVSNSMHLLMDRWPYKASLMTM